MTVANVALIRIHWQAGGLIDMFSLIHAQAPDSQDPYDDEDLFKMATAVGFWWDAPSAGAEKMCGAYSPEVVLQTVDARRIQPTDSDWITVDYSSPGTADGFTIPAEPQGLVAITVNALPPQVCWCITLKTQLDTRSGRGRLYLPATQFIFEHPLGQEPSEDTLATGQVWSQIQEQFRGRIANLRNELFLGPPEGRYVMSVWSRKHEQAFAVTGYAWSDYLRTQRRRTVRPGTWNEFGLHPTAEDP